MLDTDKMQEWAVSYVSFDTVSKILPNPAVSMYCITREQLRDRAISRR